MIQLTCSRCGCVHVGVACSEPTITTITTSTTGLALVSAALTDDQLRAECAKRDIRRFATSDELADLGMAYLQSCSSDELRAECERRWPNVADFRAWLWAGLEKLGMGGAFSEEQWARRVDKLLTSERERDEWKRRAEEAEAREKVLRGGVMPCGHHHSHLPVNGTTCGYCDFNARRTGTAPPAETLPTHSETGPGIAALKLEPRHIDWSDTPDDEDLLCVDTRTK